MDKVNNDLYTSAQPQEEINIDDLLKALGKITRNRTTGIKEITLNEDVITDIKIHMAPTEIQTGPYFLESFRGVPICSSTYLREWMCLIEKNDGSIDLLDLRTGHVGDLNEILSRGAEKLEETCTTE